MSAGRSFDSSKQQIVRLHRLALRSVHSNDDQKSKFSPLYFRPQSRKTGDFGLAKIYGALSPAELVMLC